MWQAARHGDWLAFLINGASLFILITTWREFKRGRR